MGDKVDVKEAPHYATGEEGIPEELIVHGRQPDEAIGSGEVVAIHGEYLIVKYPTHIAMTTLGFKPEWVRKMAEAPPYIAGGSGGSMPSAASFVTAMQKALEEKQKAEAEEQELLAAVKKSLLVSKLRRKGIDL